MRKILFILFLLPVIAQAQSINNQKVRWTQPIYMGSNTAATVNASTDTGAFFFDRADSVLYFKYKGSARALGYAGSIPNVGAQISDSLRALVRLRAQGSGGIDVQNSSGTSVASFGSGGTTNISLNGSTNVNARLSVTDSIVGVSQRLTGTLNTGGNGTIGGNLAVTGTSLFSSGVQINGNIGQGTTAGTTINLTLRGDITGSTTALGQSNEGLIRSGVTVRGTYSRSILRTEAASFTIGTASMYSSEVSSIGAGSTITNLVGFDVLSNFVGGTNTYGFRGQIASGTNRWNLFMSGTAANHIQGDVLIGTTSNPNSRKLLVSGTSEITGATTLGSTLSVTGALTATAQGNNIAVTVDSTTITTSNYTLVLGDAGKFFRVKNGSTALTITIPANSSVAFPVGTLIGVQQQGTAQITFSPASGVVIESGSDLYKTGEKNAGVYLMKTSGDIWLLVGNRG